MVSRSEHRWWKAAVRHAVVPLLISAFCWASIGTAEAAPIEYNAFAAIGGEGFMGWADGRMGFRQGNDPQPSRGTLNDLKTDLGLPTEQRSLKLSAGVRVLEHHCLRMYGYVPEYYKGGRVLTRELRTLNTTYPAGTNLESLLERGSFGMGYDLDFIVGPTWYAGLNGDVKYLHTRIRMLGGLGAGREDTIIVDELVPCVGAHMEAKFPRLAGFGGRSGAAGAFARMTYSIVPNFVNYVDVSIGFSLEFRPRRAAMLRATVGYEHESLFVSNEPISGKVLEMKRDGVTFSIAGAF